ncbi:MAG: T9SS type A sorting domain-containing protein [bacterium]|nr:T9SS type A sorting domain-containing protein [bacterium]
MLKKYFIWFFVMFSLAFQSLNAQDFAISTANQDQLYPDVAFDGTNFWTVWADKRSGTYQIYGARITPNGVLLDTNGILLASLPDTDYTMPSVAFGDSIGCIAFRIEGDTITSTHVLKNDGILRFNKNGYVIDSIPSFLYGYKLGNFDYFTRIGVPTVVYGKNHFFLFVNGVWQYSFEGGYDGNIYAVTDSIFGGGSFADTILFGISSPTIGNALAGIWNGERILGVWDKYWDYSVILGSFFEDSLYYDSTAYKDTFRINDMGSTYCGYSDKPRELAFSGSRYLLVSERGDWYNGVWYTILSDSGKPIDSLPTIIDTNGSFSQTWPTCTYSDGKFIAVWQDSTPANTNLYGAIIDTFGAIIDTGYINYSSIRKVHPSLATGAGKTLLVWADNRNGDFNIYGSFMFPDSIGAEESKLVGTDYNLSVSKNPFSKSTVITYSVGAVFHPQYVSLAIYDLTGRCVKTLVPASPIGGNESKPAGTYTTTLNANDLKSGIYFVRLTTGNTKLTRKLILMK